MLAPSATNSSYFKSVYSMMQNLVGEFFGTFLCHFAKILSAQVYTDITQSFVKMLSA